MAIDKPYARIAVGRLEDDVVISLDLCLEHAKSLIYSIVENGHNPIETVFAIDAHDLATECPICVLHERYEGNVESIRVNAKDENASVAAE